MAKLQIHENAHIKSIFVDNVKFRIDPTANTQVINIILITLLVCTQNC